MNITITRTTSFARLDRIERYAVRAHQRLIHRAFAELDRYRIRIGQETIGPHRLVFSSVANALRWAGEQRWDCDGDFFLSTARGGEFGLRLARIVRRAEALDAAAETVSEEYGTRDGRSAADCAAWSDRQYGIACWEDRHGERWKGEW
jgi:hypothetical protein